MRKLIVFAAIAAVATAAPAQFKLPVIVPLGKGQPAPVDSIDALRADFTTRVGGDTVYFSGDSAGLTAQAQGQLQAQAQWLLQHPASVVRIEGHGDGADTRSHALGVGARRAEAVRNYLMLLGVPGAQVTTMSWGKERPGPPRTVTVVVQ